MNDTTAHITQNLFSSDYSKSLWWYSSPWQKMQPTSKAEVVLTPQKLQDPQLFFP